MISHAEEVASWMESRLRSRRWGAALYLVLMPAYLVWIGSLFNARHPVLASLFLAANLIDFVLGLVLIFFTWHHPRRTAPTVPARSYPVDVLVPVYTESVEMIEMTLRAAKNIEFPHETYVLDDGHRTEIRELADRLEVHYLSRPDRRGAKAGNLNHGLRHASGELVAVFDADHIPRRDALSGLVGYFDDARVALVQAPQFYYNDDALTYQIARRSRYVAGGKWNEQALYYDLFQQGRDAFNAMSSVGTCVLYRRRALDEAGGFPETTVTEDLHLSLLLHRRGWLFIHVNEPIAWGLAASDLSEFYRTRQRWMHGNLQVMRQEKIFSAPGLTWWQRFSYVGLTLYALEAWQQLLYLLIPAWALLFIVSPIVINLWSAILVPLCVALRIGSVILLGGGYVRFIDDQVISLGRMPIILVAWWGLTGRSMVWKVSQKTSQARISWPLLIPHFAIIVLNLGVISYALIRLEKLELNHFVQLYIYSFSLVWVFFNIWKAFEWIYKSIQVAGKTSEEYRFAAPIPFLDQGGNPLGHFDRLSTREGTASFRQGFHPEAETPVQLLLPGRNVAAVLAPATSGETNLYSFRCDDPDGLLWLRQTLYSVDWHRQIRLAPFCRQTQEKGLGRPWVAASLLWAHAPASWAVFQPPDEALSVQHLIAASPLNAGEEVTLCHLQAGRMQRGRYRIRAQIPVHPPIPRDLNRQNYFLFQLDALTRTSTVQSEGGYATKGVEE
jgi:cellulose synthase (UDP-forming)